MNAREIRPGVSMLGTQDFDRRLFDELIPLPDGTSYNAYIVKGSEKVALIDAVDPVKSGVLMRQLASVKQIATWCVNTWNKTIPEVFRRSWNVIRRHRSSAVPRQSRMLVDHLHVDPEKITVVEDGETISLGDRTF